MNTTGLDGERAGPWQLLLLTVVGMICVGMAWQWMIVAAKIPHYIVPPPLSVLATMASEAPLIARQTALTLSSSVLGLLLSSAVAVTIAVAFTLSRRVEQATMPIVIAFRSAPVAAVAPIIMLFLGRSVATSVIVVMIVSFFPLLVNLIRGLKAADRTAAEMLRIYDASPFQQLVLLRAPAAAPYFFSGLRIASATALLGAMLSEWITGTPGLGKLILDSGDMRETELLWAAVLAAIALSLCVFAATAWAERRVLRWRT